MKKCSILASLAAIVLLSCSYLENPNSPVEEVDYSQPQSQPLQKVSTISGEQGIALKELSPGNVAQGFSDPEQSIQRTSGLYTAYNCGSMSVSGVPYGYTAWSSKAICDFTSLPPGSLNTSYQFIGSGPTGSGTFSPQYVEIICGQYWIPQFVPSSYANISTNAFAGTPANVRCSLRFFGQCVGTSYGGGSCSFSVSNIRGIQSYSY